MPGSRVILIDMESDLLERARGGDRDAHAALYRAHAPMIFTLARRMLGSTMLAEDVLQDSFVEVIRSAGQFRGDGDMAGWIRRIAVNKCLSHLRSPWARRRVIADELQTPSTSGDSGCHSMAPGIDRTLEHRTELESALARLSATARAVVWLFAVEGYTHEEIGRLMGRSTSFSKTQFARARQRLRDILEPETNEPAIHDEETEPCLGVLKTV